MTRYASQTTTLREQAEKAAMDVVRPLFACHPATCKNAEHEQARKIIADAIERVAVAFAEDAVKTFALGVKRAAGKNAKEIYKVLGRLSAIVLDATDEAIAAAERGKA